jgi:uncharacterized membrane protein YphA (DoxX/SURF4 family)
MAGLLNLFPPPPNLPQKLMLFMNGIMATGYFIRFLKSVETVCGLFLLLGMYVPLALVVLAPIVINIFMVHVFLDTSGLPMALFIGALEIYLAFFSPVYSPKIKALFRRD